MSHVLKSLFFNQNNPKMKLFLQKNAKFSSAGGSAPRPPCLRRLGALPPNLQPPASGGFAPRPQSSPPWRISGYVPACEAAAYYLPQKGTPFFAFSSIKIVLIGNKRYQCKLVFTGTMNEWSKILTIKTLTEVNRT